MARNILGNNLVYIGKCVRSYISILVALYLWRILIVILLLVFLTPTYTPFGRSFAISLLSIVICSIMNFKTRVAYFKSKTAGAILPFFILSSLLFSKLFFELVDAFFKRIELLCNRVGNVALVESLFLFDGFAANNARRNTDSG